MRGGTKNANFCLFSLPNVYVGGMHPDGGPKILKICLREWSLVEYEVNWLFNKG